MSTTKVLHQFYIKLVSCISDSYMSKPLIHILSECLIAYDSNKNNIRWYSSKDFFASGMTMLIIHQELIEGTINEYKARYGQTLVIKNIEYVFRKVILYN